MLECKIGAASFTQYANISTTRTHQAAIARIPIICHAKVELHVIFWVHYSNVLLAAALGQKLQVFACTQRLFVSRVSKNINKPMLHAFTGSDTSTPSCEDDKNIAWTTWECLPEASEYFLYLSICPSDCWKSDLELLRNL